MATRKSAGKVKTKSDNELGKLLSTSKVLRTVTAIGGDALEFEKLYLADTSRGPKAQEWSADQEKAIKVWLAKPNTKNAMAMQEALEVKSLATAFKAAMAFQDAIQD